MPIIAYILLVRICTVDLWCSVMTLPEPSAAICASERAALTRPGVETDCKVRL